MKIRQPSIAVTVPVTISEPAPFAGTGVDVRISGEYAGRVWPSAASPGIPREVAEAVRAAVDWSEER